MRAVDAVMECLKAEGVEVVFGLPGGANLPTYDAFYDAGIRHVLVRHEAGGGHAAEGYAKATGKVGRRAGHLGPRRDEPRHGHRRRDDGLGSDRLHHRPGPYRPARHRRVPGGRHDRDHHPGRQAQLHGPAPARDPAGHPRGVLPGAQRPPGPGRRRHPGRPLARGHPVRAGHGRQAPGLPADHGRQPEADPPGGEGARGGPAPGHLRRGRRHQRQRLRPSCRTSRPPTASPSRAP